MAAEFFEATYDLKKVTCTKCKRLLKVFNQKALAEAIKALSKYIQEDGCILIEDFTSKQQYALAAFRLGFIAASDPHHFNTRVWLEAREAFIEKILTDRQRKRVVSS
jgi:hypothetical protein